MKISLIRNAMSALVLAGAFGAADTALADKKCHNCDFSDEPITVVGKPAKKSAIGGAIGAKASDGSEQHQTLPGAKKLPTLPPVPPVVGSQTLAAKPGGGVKAGQTHCSSVSACNELIATCAAGGQWVPGGYNDKGQPTSGDCFK